jgi:hypothetical protein
MNEEPIQQKTPTPSGSDKPNKKSDQRQPPLPIQTDAAPESRSALTKYEVPHKTEKTRWDKAKPWVELAGVILLAIYTGFTIRMYYVNKRAADAAEKAANAAKSAAETAADSLAQSKTAFEIDERAWVGVVSVESLRDITNDSAPGFAVAFVNAGKSPAFNLRSDVQVYVASTLPETSPSHHTPYQTRGGTTTVLPGKEGKTGYGILDHNLSIEEVTAIAHGVKFICIYGTLTYADIFTTDKAPRITRFCSVYYPGNKTVRWGVKACLKDNEMQ